VAKVKTRRVESSERSTVIVPMGEGEESWHSHKVKLNGRSCVEIYVGEQNIADGNPAFVLEFGQGKLYVRAHTSYKGTSLDRLLVGFFTSNCVVLERVEDVVKLNGQAVPHNEVQQDKRKSRKDYDLSVGQSGMVPACRRK
jgi:hypothetical protein